jgi:hypothetical protein
MLGQFEHLAEAYFTGFKFDVGERELDRILSVEHDLDSFIGAIGLSKHELETVMRDEGELVLVCVIVLLITSPQKSSSKTKTWTSEPRCWAQWRMFWRPHEVPKLQFGSSDG